MEQERGRGTSPGEVHDTALKAAETDATKRALSTFGKPFGLELYRKDKNAVSASSPTVRSTAVRVSNPAALRFASRRYNSNPEAVALLRPAPPWLNDRPPAQDQAFSSASATNELPPTGIDKSQLAIAEPKRLRDKAHLKFVASQPCLICGRQPSDPHHLRFAQPRAIGLKVSDEFTVPLCRGHHRQLHQAGNELAWWKKRRKRMRWKPRGALWEETHASTKQAATLKVVPKLAELQTKLDSVRREVRNLTVMGMDPNQTTEQAALVKEFERSARAEQRLRKMALDYAKSLKT